MSNNVIPHPKTTSPVHQGVIPRLQNVLRSLPLLTSTEWTASTPLPSEYRAHIAEALPLAEAAASPAGPKAKAVALADLSEWLDVYAPVPLPTDKDERLSRITAIVQRIGKDLGDLPGDLLAKAVRSVTQSHEYSKLPLPGEFRSHVDEELARRCGILQRLQTAAGFAKFEEAPGDREIPTDTQRETVREMLKAAGIGLRTEDAGDLEDEVSHAHEAEASVSCLPPGSPISHR